MRWKGLRGLLHWLGKGERKVAAVFGWVPQECHAAVLHLRRGAPEIPVWLFSTTEPLPETTALCERVYANRRSTVLFTQAQIALWPVWVAIALAPWTGGRGPWLVKLAPFLLPPFRILILNASGGFFAGTPPNILLHLRRRLRDVALSGWNRIKDVTSSLSLLLATAVLRWCGYPDRKLFLRLHGDEPLPVTLPADTGSGMVRFRHDETLWDTAEVWRLVSSSETRWVLFQPDGPDACVDDLLPLFEDQRTFAVSRQEYYRECRTLLFGMAPFRALQPAEASQVLAPLSGTILVDRGKLAALGVPKVRLSGTAWLLLFWKAAAAGWRSYSVGTTGDLRRQPDFPPQERAFLLRVLSDPALKRLGPREPDLARGNIAFAPAGRRAGQRDERRLKVLVVSPFLPYPLSHGGAVRIYNLCRVLARRVEFILVAMRESREVADYGKLHEIFREVYVADRDELAFQDGSMPKQVREHESRSVRALIADLARRFEPDVLQIEYTHMAQFRDSAARIPALLVEHDLTFALYRQLEEHRPSKPALMEYERWLAFERHWLSAYDAVWTVSAEDHETAVREGNRPPGRTFTIPNGVDTTRFVPSPETAVEPEVLFVGSFRHLPNVLAFEKLLGEVMPRVWHRLPIARLRVVAGPEHERFYREVGGNRELLQPDPRVEVHGFVEDVRPLYARASVVAAPLVVSAGTNVKVLEAMACGKAIVTTPAGCGGLGLHDGQEILVATEWGAFVDAVCGLLTNPAQRAHLGARARSTAVSRFSWDAIAEGAYRSYVTLLEGQVESGIGGYSRAIRGRNTSTIPGRKAQPGNSQST